MNTTPDKTEPKAVWCCGECGEPHRYQSDAVECCMDPPREMWACGRCSAPHADYQDAELCCFDENGDPRPPSPAELEAMGQQRLPLTA